MKRFLAIILTAMLLVSLLVLSGCGSSGKESVPEGMEMYDRVAAAEKTADGGYNYDYSEAESPKEAPPSEITGGDAEGKVPNVTDGRKVIYSSDFTIETKDFPASCKALESLIEKYGGYIESSDIYTGDDSRYRKRYAAYTIRIPVENYKKLTSDAGNVGNVVSKRDNNRDVTESYFDIESRITTLESKRDRLLALLDQAKDMYEVVTLNDALENTLYDIERLTGQLKKYDSLIDYSTVIVTINEVSEITEIKTGSETLGERIANAFNDSVKWIGEFFEGLVVVLSALLPVVIVLLPIIVIIIIILRIIRKKKNKKSDVTEK